VEGESTQGLPELRGRKLGAEVRRWTDDPRRTPVAHLV